MDVIFPPLKAYLADRGQGWEEEEEEEEQGGEGGCAWVAVERGIKPNPDRGG